MRTTPDDPRGLWHYVEHRSGERGLYDISGGPCYAWDSSIEGDPCQLQNLLASDVGAEAEALAAVLADELARLKAEVAPEPLLKADAGA